MTSYRNFFPEVTKKICSSDKPYINEKIKGQIHLKLKLFRLEKKEDALALHKQIKKEIRRAASRFGKNKLNYLKQNKCLQWFKKLKELGGCWCKNLDFLQMNHLNRCANVPPFPRKPANP